MIEGRLSADLDASALLPTLIGEPGTEAVYERLGAHERELLVGDFAAAGVTSALSRLIRTRRLQADVWRIAARELGIALDEPGIV